MSDESIAAATGLSLPFIAAIRAVESGGIASQCRFEPHVFRRIHGGTVVSQLEPKIATDALRMAIRASGHVPFTPDPLRHISLSRYETDRSAFEFARGIDGAAAVRSASWGSFQVLGGHLLAIAGPDASMAVSAFDADPSGMSDRLLAHWIAANPAALAAAKRGDVDAWVQSYNGSAPGTPQHDHYAARMRTALAAA